MSSTESNVANWTLNVRRNNNNEILSVGFEAETYEPTTDLDAAISHLRAAFLWWLAEGPRP